MKMSPEATNSPVLQTLTPSLSTLVEKPLPLVGKSALEESPSLKELSEMCCQERI